MESGPEHAAAGSRTGSTWFVVGGVVALLLAVLALTIVLGMESSGERADVAATDRVLGTTVEESEASEAVSTLTEATPEADGVPLTSIPAEDPAPRTTLRPVRLTPEAASASSTRPAVAQLRCGGSNRFDPELLIDGTLQYGWGPEPGDGTGSWIELDFGSPVTLTEIGLTPGYLRVSPRSSENCREVSAFGFNRFVESVEYQFDDGSAVTQVFLDDPSMQRMSIQSVTTQRVRVLITSTMLRPGADDDTILSEIEFLGHR